MACGCCGDPKDPGNSKATDGVLEAADAKSRVFSGALLPTRPEKWDERLLDLAAEAASWSKDSSSKVGAVLVGPSREPLSFAYNGFCRGVDDSIPERSLRPEKYLWTEHAERNALWNHARRVLAFGSGSRAGLTLYATRLPSADGARALAQSGISTLVVSEGSVPLQARPDASAVEVLLAEAGVSLRVVPAGQADKWTRRLLSVGARAASWSKTAFPEGAVLVDGERTPVSFGYDGLPRGLSDEDPNWAAHPDLVEEAVQNAVLNAIRPSLAGASLYVTHFPCVRCCRAIVQAGVARVVADADQVEEGFAARWSADILLSAEVLRASKIECVVVGRGSCP